MLVSRIAALAIVFTLLPAFLITAALGVKLDATIVLAFLGIASGLLFGNVGWYVVRRSNSSPDSSDLESRGGSGGHSK